jgi:hypothetical protein
MSVAKAATTVVASVPQTEMAVGHLTSASAVMPSKTVSSLQVVVVVLVRRAQVVTVVPGKLALMALLVWRVPAKDAARMRVQVAMARVLVVVTVAALLVGSPVVVVAPE